jgi:S1-C subfamily serine protease
MMKAPFLGKGSRMSSHTFRSAGVWLGAVAAVLAGGAAWVLTVHRDAPGQDASDEQAAGEVSAMADDPKPVAPSSDAAVRTEEPKAKSRSRPAAARDKADAGEFSDPSVIRHRFTTEMSRLLKQGKLVAPAELFRQAERAKRCDVVPLPDPGQRLSSEAIYARARPGVVVVGALLQPKGHRHVHVALASGFSIRGDGVIVTNYHVLEAFQHARAVGVSTDDQRVFPVKAVLAADELNDLAVVKVEAENLAALPVAASAPVGAPAYCLSHPALDTGETETAFYAFTQGIVCGKFRLRLAGPAPLDVLAITAEYGKGSSGGPILNEHGAVVGIICQTRALFHDEDESEPQLTWKFSRPSSSLLALLKAPDKAK